MSMGKWKVKKLKKAAQGGKASTASKKARIYLAFPPPTGWPGGDPIQNGYRRKAG